MTDDSQPTNLAALPSGYRGSGLLLHLTSLPTPYGIGDMGPAALSWVDRLAEAGQSWWQFLPLGPAGAGNSPYSSESSFAGNWLLISPDGLIADGLLQASDVVGGSFSQSTVEYEAVTAFKNRMLETVWTNFHSRAGSNLKPAFAQFCRDQASWLDDYALFQALKGRYRSVGYLEWPAELARRSPDALAQARRELASKIDQICLAQFLVFRQGQRLKEYAHARGVRLIGDLPFFVSADSSDVWADPELFLLDEHYQPRVVAGVPPDYFSDQGQLWGNPIFDWEALRRTGYRWCIDRMRALLTQVDLIRLDHFRGFAAAWQIPAGAATAESGRWVPGPGADFFARSAVVLAACRSLRRTWGLSRLTWMHSATSFSYRGLESFNSPSTANLKTRISPRILFPTRSFIRGRMTTTPRADGTRNSPMNSGRSFVITCSVRSSKAIKPPRHCCEWHGCLLQQSRWPPFKICSI